MKRISLIVGLILSVCACEQMKEVQVDVEELQTGQTEQSAQIATLDTQLEGVNATISQLEATDTELRNYINTLQEQKTALEATDGALSSSIEDLGRMIMELQTKDNGLQGQITALKQYAEVTTKAYIDQKDTDVKDWAGATFTTLEQYAALNESLEELRETVSSHESEYPEIINSVVAASEASVLAQVNTVLESLSGRIKTLEDSVAKLGVDIDKILGMVQSVILIPEYNDGSVSCRQTTDNEFCFEVKPSGLAPRLAAEGKDIFRMKAVYTRSRADVKFIEMPINQVSADGDILIVRASGRNITGDVFTHESDISANASLTIESGASSYSTDYFPLCCREEGLAFSVLRTETSAFSATIAVDIADTTGLSEYGVVYGKDPIDSLVRGTVVDSEGNRLVRIGSLDPGSFYYFRAYAVLDSITFYSGINSFNTKGLKELAMEVEVNETTAFSGAITASISEADIDGWTCGVCYNSVFWTPPIPPTVADSTSTAEYVSPGIYTATLTGLSPDKEYCCRAFIRKGDTIIYSEAKTFRTQEAVFLEGPVDLGLSVMWASCNLGAESPTDTGDLFAWGETAPKSEYSWATYKWCNGTNRTLTKYCSLESYGTVDNKRVLDPEDDAAKVNLGDKWRMPTEDDYRELLYDCTWELTTIAGVNGYKISGKRSGYTDKWIFLPARLSYWIPAASSSSYGRALGVNDHDIYYTTRDKSQGNPIRPVHGDDLGSVSILGYSVGLNSATVRCRFPQNNPSATGDPSVWFFYSDTATNIEDICLFGTQVMATKQADGTFSAHIEGLEKDTEYNYVACVNVGGFCRYSSASYFTTDKSIHALRMPSRTLPSDTDTLKILVRAYEDWSIDGIPEWMTPSLTEGHAGETNVSFIVAENIGKTRSAEITFKGDNESESYTITQSSPLTEIKIIFADGTDVFRKVLTPSLAPSIVNGFDLGPTERALTAMPEYVMEFYSRGSTLTSTKDGLRIRTDPSTSTDTYPTEHQIREENFAYIKFPALPGKRLISVSFESPKTNAGLCLGPSCGPTNADALVSGTSTRITTNGVSMMTVKDPQVNTPYYLLMFIEKTEYRFYTITVVYDIA